MVGSKARARKTQVEPGSACGTESKEVIKKIMGLSKEYRRQPEGAPNGQSWDSEQ